MQGLCIAQAARGLEGSPPASVRQASASRCLPGTPAPAPAPTPAPPCPSISRLAFTSPYTAVHLLQVVIIPSFGERYLSSPLFAALREECEKLTAQ